MREIGSKVIDEERQKELKEYENNFDLFEGEHYEVFKDDIIARLKKSGYSISEAGMFQMQYVEGNGRTIPTNIPLKSLFVSENVLGSSIKVFRNFLFGEMVEITTENETENLFIKVLAEEVELYNKCLKGAIYQSVNGFAVFKISKDENNNIEIDLIENEYVKINPMQNNKNKIDNIEISYTTEENGINILHTETHYKGYYEVNKYEIKDNKILREIITEENQENKIFTGISDFAVVIINNELTDDLVGNSDFTESVINLQKEIDVRLTQSAMSLDKTQNPMMQLPASIVRKDFSTGENYVDVIGKGILSEQGDTEPKYIEYNGNYETVEEIIKNRRNSLYSEMSIVSAIFDTEKLGNASGTALKIKLMPTLSAVLMKKNQWEFGLNKLVKLSYQMLFNASMGELSFKWYNGIPVDRREEAEISKIRTGADKTQSVISSIMEQDGKTEEQAQLEYQRILYEEKQQQEAMTGFGVDAGGV